MSLQQNAIALLLIMLVLMPGVPAALLHAWALYCRLPVTQLHFKPHLHDAVLQGRRKEATGGWTYKVLARAEQEPMDQP